MVDELYSYGLISSFVIIFFLLYFKPKLVPASTFVRARAAGQARIVILTSIVVLARHVQTMPSVKIRPIVATSKLTKTNPYA